MYNESVKQMFLDSLKGRYTEGTIRLFEQMFKKSERTENMYKKDIYEMNLDECRQVLKSYSNRSVEMFSVNRSRLESYKAWAISEGYDSTLINFFSMLTIADAEEYIDLLAIEDKVISYEQLLEFENDIENYQDYIVLVLPFFAVYGKEAVEIRNFKISDLYPDYIQLETRKVPIDEKIYEIITKTINEEDYSVGNGDPGAGTKATEREINKTEYVVRYSGRTKSGQVNYQLVKGRVDRLKKYLGNNITITNLMLSGKVHVAKQILAEKGSIEKEDWVFINERFGVAPNKSLDYWTVTRARVSRYL
jgi:hypothetical protein